MDDCRTDVRRQCPMRHSNGNCLPAGGFCPVTDYYEICKFYEPPEEQQNEQ